MAIRPEQKEESEEEESEDEKGEGVVKDGGVGARIQADWEGGNVKRMNDPRRPPAPL